MASLAEIRARLTAQESKKSNNYKSGDSAVYPHWNIEEDDTATLRFLEDGDTDNPDFWIERAVFKFPFNGIKANAEHHVEASDKTTIVQIPCMEMYGDKDPILDEVRTWFKDTSLEEMGRKYWKKRSYIFQGFVREDPMTDSVTPENPIRRFIISPQIHTLIKAGLMDPDMEELPTDKDIGLDFRVKKTTKGGYSDYTTSSYARKESPLTQEELEAIEEHGLFNLKDFLPAKPNAETLDVIREMFEASVEGEAYDVEKWGKYYTPYGVDKVRDNQTSQADDKTETKTEVKEEAKAAVKPKVTKVETKTAEAEANDTTVDGTAEEEPAVDDKAQAILAMIRSRQ